MTPYPSAWPGSRQGAATTSSALRTHRARRACSRPVAAQCGPPWASEVAGLRLDSVTHSALYGDSRATLTPIEFRVLSTLLSRPSVVNWPDGSTVLDNTPDACLS